ncbi:MAG: hypothetical protein IJ615_11205 [Bacteroidaceae bacterium]|nr:hypothetical protein [Bacteroidaceae bacterium]
MECKDSKLLQAAIDFQNSPQDPEINDIKDFFIAGAQWMASQGTTVETIMQNDDLDELVPTLEDMRKNGFKEGDKVIVQIKKKDEPQKV